MQPGNSLEHAKHVFRAAILLLMVVVTLLLGRSLFVPPTWGEYGSYRGANVEEHRSRPVLHGGDRSCEPCHSEQYEIHLEGVHHSLRCEMCHGPVARHVDLDEGEVVAEMPVKRSRELCENCHRFLSARPSTFPQIDPREHITDNGGELSADACFDCHDPHSPI